MASTRLRFVMVLTAVFQIATIGDARAQSAAQLHDWRWWQAQRETYPNCRTEIDAFEAAHRRVVAANTRRAHSNRRTKQDRDAAKQQVDAANSALARARADFYRCIKERHPNVFCAGASQNVTAPPVTYDGGATFTGQPHWGVVNVQGREIPFQTPAGFEIGRQYAKVGLVHDDSQYGAFFGYYRNRTEFVMLSLGEGGDSDYRPIYTLPAGTVVKMTEGCVPAQRRRGY